MKYGAKDTDPVVLQEIGWLQIDFDETSTRTRALFAPNEATVREYLEIYEAGQKLPPPVVFKYDDHPGRYYLADGYHRWEAWRRYVDKNMPKKVTLECEVHRIGGRAGAILYALGANAKHGLKRTNDDKRRCIEVALVEFPKTSDREIAQWCGVSDKTVGKVRDEVRNFRTCENETRIGADGKEYPVKRKEPKPVNVVYQQLDFFRGLAKQPTKLPSEEALRQIDPVPVLKWFKHLYPELGIEFKKTVTPNTTDAQ